MGHENVWLEAGCLQRGQLIENLLGPPTFQREAAWNGWTAATFASVKAYFMSLTPFNGVALGEPIAAMLTPFRRASAGTRRRYCAGKLLWTKRMFITGHWASHCVAIGPHSGQRAATRHSNPPHCSHFRCFLILRRRNPKSAMGFWMRQSLWAEWYFSPFCEARPPLASPQLAPRAIFAIGAGIFEGFRRGSAMAVSGSQERNSAGDHDLSRMAPPSRMMRAQRSRIALNMSTMAAPILRNVCRPWRTILPAV